MAIYTRTGDDGTTALFGGRRISKADSQVDVYGSIDELTTVLGVFMMYVKEKREKDLVEHIQQDLYIIMSFLAGAPANLLRFEKKITLFEKKIDTLALHLRPLTHFILPHGSPASCWAHMARVICRRSERSLVRYFQEKKLVKKTETCLIIKYINRLSDLLFTYARYFNKGTEVILKKNE